MSRVDPEANGFGRSRRFAMPAEDVRALRGAERVRIRARVELDSVRAEFFRAPHRCLVGLDEQADADLLAAKLADDFAQPCGAFA